MSDRQADVLWWLTRGASNATMAKELGLTVGTVKNYPEHVYRKLGVSTRAAAVALAFDTLAAI
jgi:DNA-binding CsgD family transcriptional regulator